MIVFLTATVLLTAPPASTQQSERRQRVAEIHELARSDAPDKIKEFVKLLSRGQVWERHAAMLALRPAHKPLVRPALEAMLTSAKVALRLESCVQRYRLWPSKETSRCLSKLRDYGSNLRRAFQIGEKRGRPIYDKRAVAFLLDSLRHKNLYTRLDGAMGLIEHDADGRGKAGLVVLNQELASPRARHRLAVVQHLSVEYVEPKLTNLLQLAKKDADKTVRQTATEILARQ